MFKGWTSLIDTSVLAGWVRAGVSVGLGLAIARWPLLGQWLDPSIQDAVGALAGTVIVGLWSHVAKKIDG